MLCVNDCMTDSEPLSCAWVEVEPQASGYLQGVVVAYDQLELRLRCMHILFGVLSAANLQHAHMSTPSGAGKKKCICQHNGAHLVPCLARLCLFVTQEVIIVTAGEIKDCAG